MGGAVVWIGVQEN